MMVQNTGKINYRDNILAAVHEIVKRKNINEFEVGEIVEFMLGNNPRLNASTIRTHITSRCCVNASANHSVTYNDYERIGRGLYRLFEEPIQSGTTDRELYFVDVNMQKNCMLALDVGVHEVDGTKRVQFFDTDRGRGFEGEVLIQDERGFIFRTKHGDVMTFRVATAMEFDESWRRSIEGSVPNFRKDEDLHQWYYKQFLG